MNLFDFLATQAGTELVRIIEGVVNIVAAILTGAALRSIFQLRKMIGGIVKPHRLRRLVTRIRGGRVERTEVKVDPFQSLTLAEKVDMLKANQEIISLRQGVDSEDFRNRLDRVDPPTRRH